MSIVGGRDCEGLRCAVSCGVSIVGADLRGCGRVGSVDGEIANRSCLF